MEYLLGGIALFPYGFVPMYWMACEGQTLQVSQNQALFSIIGNTYGGNGSTTFALPDLRNASPLTGMRYCIATSGIYPQRS
ncbi:tail collar domain [Ruminiclostridium sufflavum DSM 19573]|uniref:Tail collar domain n=1 Tax=Ruminiclostridium sufflavum DSM 19573 TaxID=1121337 RepID=A0A318XRW0_9FIRM|nr:tail fiber protein [Ruminiclostridium sufflavum]PYG90337.1 tail collar domain [Ruminiclostridium sufflavum DSM 19573]